MVRTRRTAIARILGLTSPMALIACGGGGSNTEPSTAAASPAPAPSPLPASPPPSAPAPEPLPAPTPAPAAGSVAGVCSPTDHPNVGKTAMLSTRSHLVSGQVKIVDSCTIEITNFTYDGLGLSKVEVYGGLGGNYRNGFPIGPNLRGTVFTGQTLRVLMKPGDIDKLDGISIWCSDANANFGDARFI
jgi:Electron transfer DM13